MAVPLDTGGDDDEFLSVINTTPLVDVMLVLLIIFLITIPVVIKTIPVDLPKEANQPSQIPPGSVTISVTRAGTLFWNEQPLAGDAELSARLRDAGRIRPQPELRIRGDRAARYEPFARLLSACRRAGIEKVVFVTEPPAGGDQLTGTGSP